MSTPAHDDRIGRTGAGRVPLRLVRPVAVASPGEGTATGPGVGLAGTTRRQTPRIPHVGAAGDAHGPALDDDTVEAFQAHVIERGRSRRTAQCYASDLYLLADWAGGSVAFADLDRVAAAWLTEHRSAWSAATVRRRLASVRAFGRHHGLEVLADYKAPTPARGVAHPVDGGRDSIMAMIDIADTPRQRFVLAACGIMGLRVSEAVSMHVADIDLERGRMRVTGKGAKDRWVPVPESARPFVTAAVDGRAGHERVAAVTTRTVSRWVADLGRDAGLGHVKTHDLRHTAGTHAYRKSGSVRTVQTLLGHADPRTTAIYTAVDWDEMAEAIE